MGLRESTGKNNMSKMTTLLTPDISHSEGWQSPEDVSLLGPKIGAAQTMGSGT